MSTAAIEISSNKLTATKEQLDLARNTIARELDQNEFGLFLYNCQRLGVHPLDGMVVPIKRNESGEEKKRLTFVITVDLLRSRAAESGEYAGSDDATFVYEMKNDPNLPSDATVTVWRIVQGQRCPFTATARWEEYFPGEKQGFMWKSKPHVMLSKCAEALALRKGFPKQLFGLYIPEELQRENEPTQQQPRTTTKKPTAKATEDVICNECHAINGHLPNCPHRKKQEAEATKGVDPRKIVRVQAVDARTKVERDKKGEEYTKHFRMLTCTGTANQQMTLYAFDTKMFERLEKIKADTVCIFNVGTREVSGKVFYTIESILEITGEPKEEAAQQGELIPPDKK